MMRAFILKILITAFSIGLILWLLPGIAVLSPFVYGQEPVTVTTASGATTTVEIGNCQTYDTQNGQVVYSESDCREIGLTGLLVIGLVLALVVAFVQPVIVMLTGRLLISTMGLFVIIIYGLVFMLALWLVPFYVIVSGWPSLEGILRVLVAAVLIAVVDQVLGTLLGLNIPHVTADGQVANFPWRQIERLPFARNSFLVENIRLMQVYNTIWSYGLEIAFGESKVLNVGRWVRRRWLKQADPLAGQSNPVKVRYMLQELGPTYVKIGQMVSSRSELLSPEWISELAKLQSSAQPFPYEDVKATILEELEGDPDELFAEFDHTPFAAASTAQVHRARLKTGEQVAVKVQRPQIIAKTQADLSIIRQLSRVFARRFEAARNANVEGLLGEFADGVMQELDYRNEGYHMRRMAANMESLPGIHVPVLYSAFSTSKVLTMEFINGVKLTKLEAIDKAGYSRDEIAHRFVKAIVKQLLIDGFFHGDPHPGNLFLNLETGDITFLDLGLIGQLSERERWALINLLWSLQSMDVDGLVNVVNGLSRRTRPVDETKLRDDIDNVVQRYLIYGSGAEELGDTLNALTSAMAQHGMILDQEIALAIKAILQAEEFTRTLVPDLNLGTMAFEQVSKLFVEQVTPENVVRIVREQAQKGVQEIFNRIPDLTTATWSWLDQYQKGRFSVTVETDDLVRSVDQLRRAVAPFPVAILLAGLVIGAAIGAATVGSLQDGRWEFMQGVLLGIFVLVILFSIYMAWRLWKHLTDD